MVFGFVGAFGLRTEGLRTRRGMQLCAIASEHEGLLLSMVAGTDRGRILDEKQRSSVENVISLMERENEMEMAFPQNLSMLDGRWRSDRSHQIEFSSALRELTPLEPGSPLLSCFFFFFYRLIYTTRPTPSATVFGTVSGIYQVFDTSNRTVENRIEFNLLPNMPRSPARTSVAIASKFETIDNSRLRLKITNLSIQLGNLVSIFSSQCLGGPHQKEKPLS
mmetsp:Transcript_27581/g.108111  ORF Transcript_27581/g.108111 Transcript_27581/m.108111 type:complete len:221 (-) Transcript_27581:2454-3116(-)